MIILLEFANEDIATVGVHWLSSGFPISRPLPTTLAITKPLTLPYLAYATRIDVYQRVCYLEEWNLCADEYNQSSPNRVQPYLTGIPSTHLLVAGIPWPRRQ